ACEDTETCSCAAGSSTPPRYVIDARQNLRTGTVRDTHPSFFSRVMPFLGLLIAATVAPAGHVALASPEETAAQPVPVSTAQGPAGRTGLQVYNEVCIACHAAPGIGGAPA